MEIAVVGIACRYPGANSAREFIENILAGRRYFREMPPQRWKLADYYDPDRSHPDTTYCREAAVLQGFEFNPSAFRIPQSTYRATDLAQWLALTVAKEALEDAEIDDPPRTNTAVILGNTLAGETSRAHLVRYRWPYARRVFAELLGELGIDGTQRESLLARVEERYKQPFPPVNEDNLAGGLANTIAGRICNYFDFKGGGYTVDGACSSSLLAIQEATIGLEQGLCELVLAGGVDMSLDPFELVGFAKVGALTDSDIRVYDQRASGFLPGEGCGIVVLKRLRDALRDGNRIYTIIRGVGYSSDGRGGITAPSVAGQSLAVDRAYSMAGYTFADVELIEGHGTGTPVGDRTELQTFIDAKRRHGASEDHHCGIGSIKSIIGHTKAAAGVAGFIKAALATYYRVLPPTMGLEIPNELFNQTAHIYPLMRGRRWRSKHCRASVSSAGFGGINTHITVEAHEPYDPRARAVDVEHLMQSYQNAELILLTADDADELRAKVDELLPVAKAISRAELADLAFECARRADARAVRLAIVADSRIALVEKLTRVAEQLQTRTERSDVDWTDAAAGIFLRRPRRIPRVAFLFPGQGAQYPDMGRAVRDRYAFVASHWTVCDQTLQGLLPQRLSNLVFSDDLPASIAAADERATLLRRTDIAQPAIVATSMAMTEVLRYLGIEPEVVIGHSLGEYTALWCAGGLEKTEVLRLVAQRGAAMNNGRIQPGSMLSVAAAADAVSEMICGIPGYLRISNYNAPTQTVVSGDRAAIEALAELCAVSEVPTQLLEVSGAFHSSLMKSAQDRMEPVLGAVKPQRLQCLMISPTTGGLVESERDLAPLLTRQIVDPVRFTDAISCARAEGIDTFIEVGPGSILLGLTRRCLEPDVPMTFCADPGSRRDWSGLLQTVGWMYASGLPVVPARLFENRFVRPFTLPYRPKFITSPCELEVAPLHLDGLAGELARVRPMAEAPPPARPDSAVPAVAAESPEAEPHDLFAFMRKVIMERFGYPAELVTPASRLADDLNLDSIKSAEVIAEAMERAEVRTDPSLYAKLPLGEIAARLRSAGPGAAQAAAVEPQLPDSWVRVFEPRLVAEPLRSAQEPSYAGRVLLAVMQGDPLASSVAQQLQAYGLEVEIVRQGQQAAPGAAPLNGCLVLVPPAEREMAGDAEPLASMARNPTAVPEFLLEAAHWAGKRLAVHANEDSGSGMRSFFAAVSRSGTLLGHARLLAKWDAGAATAAFVKTWSLENPGIRARMLDVDPGSTGSAIVERLLDELGSPGNYGEAAYAASGNRHVVEWAPAAALLLSPCESLAVDDVWLVSGGARGITAECIRALLARSPAKVALLGSSALAKGGKPDKEIEGTLAALGSAGIAAKYYQCDVTNSEQVGACVERVRKELGAIRGLIHAAGVNTPHRVEAVAKPAFRAVLAPKINGLLNLLKALDPRSLQQLAVFSSVIGASGMAGNADYAYANAWMGLALKRLACAYPLLQCRAFAFSVWDQIGMGARLGSVASLRRQGVEPIPAAEGVRRFVDLMHRQWRGQELIISARAGGLNTLRYADVPLEDLPFVRDIVTYQPGVELVAEALLDPATAPYIADHNYNGTLLFPAVMGIEAMSQAALRCARVVLSDSRAPSLESLRFARPIVVPPEGRRIRIYARAHEPESDGTLRVEVSIRSSVQDFDAEAFSAVCVWRSAPALPLARTAPSWPQPLSIRPDAGLYGSLFFQGPTFRHVAAFLDVSPTHCIALVQAPDSFGAAQLLEGPMLGSAAIRDCFLHAIQVCVPQFRILPVGIESLTTNGLDGRTVYVVANERLRTDKEFLYDIDVFSPAGEVVEQIRGYRCRIIDAYDDQETLSVVARLHREASERSAPRLLSAVH